MFFPFSHLLSLRAFYIAFLPILSFSLLLNCSSFLYIPLLLFFPFSHLLLSLRAFYFAFLPLLCFSLHFNCSPFPSIPILLFFSLSHFLLALRLLYIPFLPLLCLSLRFNSCLSLLFLFCSFLFPTFYSLSGSSISPFLLFSAFFAL